MGVIDISNPYTHCLDNLKSSLPGFEALRRLNCSVASRRKRAVVMTSQIPVTRVQESQQRLTGDSFIRSHLRKLSPYQPILPFEVLSTRLGRKPEDIIKLDANENPYGPPPEVLEALGTMKFPYVYPDPESRQLRAALAVDSGLESEHILIGCGADELIDLIMRCVLDPGDKIVDCPPTFTMYEFDAAVNGALVIKVPRKPNFSLNVDRIKDIVDKEKPKFPRKSDFSLNVDRIKDIVDKEKPKFPRKSDFSLNVDRIKDIVDKEKPKFPRKSDFSLNVDRIKDIVDKEKPKFPRKPDFSLNVDRIKDIVDKEKPKCIFLTSPNNPDGSVINDEDLLEILDLPILVILDEAYIEFSSIESKMQWVKKYDNLIILRTFSKRAGLAGLRVGYGAFPLSIIEYLWRAKQPYNVSVAAEIAACAALRNPSYLEKVKNALVQERERLFNLLKDVPFLNPFPSHSNFILCEVTSGKDAKKLKEDLAQMGVMIRHYDKKELKGYVRVTAGKPEHTDVLMDCLGRLT